MLQPSCRPALASLVVALLAVLIAVACGPTLGAAQRVRRLRVVSERGCNGATQLGLRCSQLPRGRPVSRFTTLEFSGTHASGGNRTTVGFAQPWTLAPARGPDGTLRTTNTLFAHGDTSLLPARVRPAESSEYHPVRVEFSLDAPLLARRLEHYAAIPYAQYFDTKTAADLGDFTDTTARAVLRNDAQYALFVNGSTGVNTTCSGEPVTFRDTLGTECSRLMGLGRASRYFADSNRNADDVRISGATTRASSWERAEFMRVNSIDSGGECTAVLCYPCAGAGVDAMTLVRSLPVGPVCHVWHAVDDVRIAVSGNATLRFNVTGVDGAVSEREYTVPVSSLADAGAVDDSRSLSALLRARVNLTGVQRQAVQETRPDGVYVVCDSPAPSGKVDMGARNPYEPRVLDPTLGVYTSAPAYRAPFYYMDTATALRYYGDDGVCKVSEHNTPSRVLYSHATLVQELCATAGDANLVRGGGVPGFAQCADAGYGETTPAHIFSALGAWTAEYGLLQDPAERAAFVRNERHPQLSPLWNPELPNMWLHTPAAFDGTKRARNAKNGMPASRQSMYVMLEPRRQLRVPVDWDLELHVHEGLVEVLEPGEPDRFPDEARTRNATVDPQWTSAPVVLAGISGCRYGGLRLEQYGLTGVDRNGNTAPEDHDDRQFGFALSASVCNVRARNVTYLVESNCTSVLATEVAGAPPFLYHSETVTIARGGAATPNTASNCYIYRTPFYGANRTQLETYVKEIGGVNTTTEHITLGSCELRISAPDLGVVYQPTVRPPSAALVDLFAMLNHTVITPSETVGHPDVLSFTCTLDTRTIELARDNALRAENAEKNEARLQVLGFLSIVLGVALAVVLLIALLYCCCSSGTDPQPSRPNKPKME
jgi:hypothetical protein